MRNELRDNLFRVYGAESLYVNVYLYVCIDIYEHICIYIDIQTLKVFVSL
jgi:hypothetical protein